MARYCDEQAELFKEVVEEGSESEVGRELADRVAMEGGDCCVPKSKR
jgi:4a-hydroxytetrahydrobiopterin dehydratase